MAIEWDDPEDRKKLWHSAAHLMAAAVLELYPKTRLTIGPAIEEGFYYDFDAEKPFSPEDFPKIEKKMKELSKKNDKFEKEEVTRKKALELFKGNKYKTELINELPEKEAITIYKSGNFFDLCRGPHIDYTSRIKAFKLLKVSSAYWRGDSKKESLQRIYGIAFPKVELLEEYNKQKEGAEKRNHLKLGRELDLFSMQEEAPGCVFFHPKGMVIWNELMGYWREEHRKAGYGEISTPLILKKQLWLTSGHWDHYKNNMYFTKIDEEDYAIKPMNCPGGMLVYKSKRHSYKEFPIRAAEVGTVHRHELSGVLNGLFRVRKFTQDDAHIFCLPEQIKEEVQGIIALIHRIYSTFGFTYVLEISTKPEKAMGSKELWDKAESSLKEALEEKGLKYKINEGDGAFYGPKIDFHIKDSLGRSWQCATIQLDFQMPEKFDLTYIDRDDKQKRPAMLHRVVFGSLERFIGILTEHYAGAFPLWLSPVQARVISVSEKHNEYAKKINEELMEAGIRSETDLRTETVGYKIRDCQLEKIPCIINVGEKEEGNGTIAVRNRQGKVEFGVKTQEFVKKTLEEIKQKK